METVAPSQTQVVSDAVATAGMTDEEKQARLDEEAEVRKFFKQFDEDQKFDKPIREQIRKDRQYASGQAQAGWAVSTNLIGSAIDVLTSTLYARNPDVSVRPAPQVDPPPDPVTGIIPPHPERQRNKDMAKSLELVLSTLWKKGHLKTRMRRVIRSILSASHGWLKVLPATEMRPNPIAQNEYNTTKDNIDRVAAQITAIEAGQTLDGRVASVEELKLQKTELETALADLANRLEVDTCYGFTFDVVKPENMQVGTDVELLEEYLDADSITEAIYIPHDQLREKFPGLIDKDLMAAEKFYRKSPINANRGEVNYTEGELIAKMYPNQGSTDDLYTTTEGQEGARAFARVLEKWNRKDNHIYTAVQGVKVWARKPYKPSWASSRFYPYFYFSLNEVDGQRCPQSLSSRGAKLQDEYASVRSNLRITRRRSIPGSIVDASALSDQELEKIEKGVIAEITPLRTTSPNQDFSKMFGAKPTPNIDMRLYDTTPIVTDLERTFGVQEALQGTNQKDMTATEATIQQTGTNTRVTTWRDTIETTLTDMAQYCAELALQEITPETAAKIAGPAVFWPNGLALEDIVSLVEVNIAAGTTGKPRNMGDREAWGVILPLVKDMIPLIAQMQGNQQTAPIAAALGELVQETMRRFGDESDVSRFLPAPPAIAPPMLPPPGAPGAPGASGAPGEPEGDEGMPVGPGPLPPGEPEGDEAVNPMVAGMENNGFFGPQ